MGRLAPHSLLRADMNTTQRMFPRFEDALISGGSHAQGTDIGRQRAITRAMARCCTLGLVILGASTGSGGEAPAIPSSTRVGPQHPRILVAFANVPQRSPGPAGTTGPRYKSDAYPISQSAHRSAQHVAAAYSLRMVDSWPIKALAIDCVVYEIPDGRAVSDLLSALAKDSRIAFAQALQEFHTEVSQRAALSALR
jgi:hypothetical protein